MEKKVGIIIGTIFLIIFIILISSVLWYKGQIKAVDKNSEEKITIEIKSGTSTVEILKILKQNELIKGEFSAKIFIKLHGIKNLQAGKYELGKNLPLEKILQEIASGNVKDETVTLTFLEGKNMRYIASVIDENTKNTSQDVFKLVGDEEYISELIKKYWFLKKDIKNESIYYPLEGYLYPDTYKFENEDVKVKEIIEKMLDKTDKVLTKYKEKIEESKYSVHEILTIASIVELEGNNAENRSKIASVIYNRLEKNMSLGSDVTTYYAFKIDMGERNLYAKEISTYNAYNTRGPNMNGKLPVGPIANSSEEAIEASLNPDDGNYLYFVADKNGEIYFSKTNEEHIETIAKLKKRGLWYEYDN